MNTTVYVISATWGEYDDCTSVPLFVCVMDIERDLFLDALNKRESPYYDKVVDYFHKEYPCTDRDSCVPVGLGFDWKKVELLSLNSQHHHDF